MGVKDCCTKFGKLILVLFNFVLWIFGISMLAVGIWMLVDKNIKMYITVIALLDGNGDLMNYSACILIGAGVFIFMVGFCGCYGAWKESKMILGLYIFFLLLIILIEFAAAILGILFKDVVSTEAGELFNKTVVEKWDVDKEFKNGVGEVQIMDLCCGWRGPEDFYGNTFSGDRFPLSCCKLTDPAGKSADELVDSDAVDRAKCITLVDGYYHLKGCGEQLEECVDDNAPILVGVCFGIIALQIIICIYAFLLCMNIGDSKIA